MAFTRTWNAAYEAIPPNTQAASQGADRMRELKLDIRERLEKDHIMNEGAEDDGKHRIITAFKQGSNPSAEAFAGILFTKEVGTSVELFYIDDDSNVFQITNQGKLLALATQNNWTAGQATGEVDVTFATSLTIDAALSNAFRVTLTNNFTLNQFSNIASGQVITVRFIQDGTGSRVLTFAGAVFDGNANDDNVLSTAVNEIDIMTFYRSNTQTYVINLKKAISSAL